MLVHTHFPQGPQQDVDGIHELSLDDEICASAFWRLRKPEDYGIVMARSAVLSGYEHGSWGATEAFNALAENDLFGSTEDFMRAYLAGVRALAAEIEPEISIAPPAGPLLEALAEGRNHG